jgi:enoyl-CoA hydratase
MSYECILVETLGVGPRKTGLIRLNRPKALNALSDPLMDELGDALYAFDADDGIGCIVLTGSEKAFAAGADIPTLAQHDFMSAYTTGLISKNWEHILRIRKPVLGAVSGFCLGGGCELAMMCDVLYAADTAKFGQPEIKLGVIPGGGGTQRLPRWVGKSKAMDMLLTGRFMDAVEAERAGLVARVVPAADLMKETLAAAETINGYAAPVVQHVHGLDEAALQSVVRGALDRGCEDRTRHVPRGVRHGESEGGHGCLLEQAGAGVAATLTKPVNARSPNRQPRLRHHPISSLAAERRRKRREMRHWRLDAEGRGRVAVGAQHLHEELLPVLAAPDQRLVDEEGL